MRRKILRPSPVDRNFPSVQEFPVGVGRPQGDFKMKCVLKLPAIGALLVTMSALPAFAQKAQHLAPREVAIHDCNVFASPYALSTWGNFQLYEYRACMARDGQAE
jgi:hypothetical protein